MILALRAFARGLWLVMLAPGLVAGVLLASMAATVPFAVVLGFRLQESLASQPPVSAQVGEIDPEWWMEFREHATGLEATFTPAIMGFAAPLGNLSAILDGAPQPWALAAPVAVSALLWAFLWGGIYDRFHRGRASGMRAFASAGWRNLPRLVAIGLAAASVVAVLYLTVHAWLFGPVFNAIAVRAGSERNAFFGRVALYIVFGSLLMLVALVADYARLRAVRDQSLTAWDALWASAAFVRAHAVSVVTLCLLTGTLFVALIVAYGLAETIGRTRLGGWRAVALGQAFIVGRLVIRLSVAASETALAAATSAPTAPDRKR